MFEIVAIRVVSAFASHPSDIQAVKLANGKILSVPEIVLAIRIGQNFFYTTSYNSHAYVEAVTSTTGRSYIRTKANSTTSDNLLNLPKF